MKAILTKYSGPTNTRGSRIKAFCEGGARGGNLSISLPYDHALNAERNHAVAAVALAKKLGWTGTLIAGGLPDSTGYCFVFSTGDKYKIG